MQQITINFQATPVEAYDSLVDYVQALTHQARRPQKAIAADMDLSPSHLSRKLAQSPNDSMALTCDNLEKWIQVNKGDLRPAYYLIQKYSKARSKEQIEAEIEALKSELEGKG